MSPLLSDLLSVLNPVEFFRALTYRTGQPLPTGRRRMSVDFAGARRRPELDEEFDLLMLDVDRTGKRVRIAAARRRGPR